MEHTNRPDAFSVSQLNEYIKTHIPTSIPALCPA